MNLLLDTCTFLWITLDPTQLSTAASQAFIDPRNTCYLSPVSAWEVAVKYSQGRLSLQQPPQQFVPSQRALHRIDFLPLEEAAALYVPSLPSLHKDPFDRMLVCQAIVQNLVILTPDPYIRQYPVQTLW